MLPLQVVAAPDASVPEHDQVPAAFAVNWKVVPWFTAGGTEGVITTCPDTGPAGAIVMLATSALFALWNPSTQS